MTDVSGLRDGTRWAGRLVGAAALGLALAAAATGGAGATQLYFDGGYHAAQAATSPQTQAQPQSAADPVDASKSVDSHGCMAGTVGQPVDFQIDDEVPPGATYSTPGAYGPTPFPIAGLSLSPSGLVTGTPTTASAGSFDYVVTDASAAGYSYASSQCYQVGSASGTSAPTMGRTYDSYAQVGEEIGVDAPQVTGFVGRLTWSVSPAPPAGIEFESGEVGGVSQVPVDWTYQVTATDSDGNSATGAPATLHVVAPPAAQPTLVNDGTCVDARDHQYVDWEGLSWSSQPDGTATFTGFPPAGMTLDPATGAITGTASDTYANDDTSFSVFVDAYWYDATGEHDAYASVCVNGAQPVPLSVGRLQQVTASLGESVSVPAPTTSGGTGGVTFDVEPPPPFGLVASNGAVSGRSAYALDYSYSVTATDQTGETATAYNEITIRDDKPRLSGTGTCIGQGLVDSQTFFAWPFDVANWPNGQATWSFVTQGLRGWAIDPTTGAITGVLHSYGHMYDAPGSPSAYPFPVSKYLGTPPRDGYPYYYSFDITVEADVPYKGQVLKLTQTACVLYDTEDIDNSFAAGVKG